MANKISDKYKAFFIHIPKTGGTSITHYIQRNGFDNYSSIHNFYLSFSSDELRQNGACIRLREVLGKTFDWNEYYKFCFIRNPWDRFVSAWKHMVRYKLAPNNLQEFLENSTHYTKTDYMLRNVTWHTIEQLPQILDESGKEMIDFIGRYENLEEDFRKVCSTIGMPFMKLPRINYSRCRDHYSTYYNAETKAKVADMYKKDIEYFGYEFEEGKSLWFYRTNIIKKNILYRAKCRLAKLV